MFDNFIIAAGVAGCGIAIICGVMGCFVVWRRMAYFGDALAHAALPGIALGLGLGFGVNIGIIIVCACFALLLFRLGGGGGGRGAALHGIRSGGSGGALATDTLLGIMAHGGLALGVVLIGAFGLRISLHDFLFGDILTVTPGDIAVIYGGGAVILSILALFRQELILLCLDGDLARVEHGAGRVELARLVFLLLMTLTVAVSVRLVGVLLVTSMLIIPAATARLFARSPEGMAAIAAAIGMGGVALGLGASLLADIPTGPAIVACLAAGFACAVTAGAALRRGRG